MGGNLFYMQQLFINSYGDNDIMSGIESLRTKLRIVRENQNGLGMKLKELKENQTNITALIKDIQRSSFKIKDGPYEIRNCSGHQRRHSHIGQRTLEP